MREHIHNEDGDTMEKFGAVLGDYKTEYFYWEVVELSRKLILSGLITLVHRGSIAQTVLATLISFFFFAFAVRAQPYRHRRLNILKVLSEFQLFGILLVCVVLQTNEVGFEAEAITIDGYGAAQIALSVIILPVALYFLAIAVCDLRELRKGSGAKETVRAAVGRLCALSVSHRKSILCGIFVWARRAPNIPKRRFPARAGSGASGRVRRKPGHTSSPGPQPRPRAQETPQRRKRSGGRRRVPGRHACPAT